MVFQLDEHSQLWHLAGVLSLGLFAHLFMMCIESRLAPRNREREYERAARLVTHGPYARVHWLVGVGLGTGVPLALIAVGLPIPAAACALVGLWFAEHLFVRAGQALPIS